MHLSYKPSHYPSCRIALVLVPVPGVVVLLHGDVHCNHHLRCQAQHSSSQGFPAADDDVHCGWLHAGIFPHLDVLF